MKRITGILSLLILLATEVMTPITYASDAEENGGGGENLNNSSIEVYVEETEGGSIEPEDQYQPSITYYYVKTINGEDTRTQLVEEGTTFDEPNIEEKEGYNFLGWYSDESCENSYDFESSIENDITLFACWKAKYTVAFDKNYGEEENDEEGRILGSIVTEDGEIIDPERLGYTFLGWSKEESCKNIFDFSEKEIKENFTVYACWEELPSFFVKSFDEDGNVLDTQKIDVGNTAVPYMTTNESGCKAVWQKDGENYDFSTPVTEDIELYAVWDCNAGEDVVEEETSGGVSDDTQSQGGSTSLDTLYDILYNTEPITKEESYAGVTVKVVAPVGSFPSNTELKITPLETVKDIKKVQDALIEQVDDIDETTFMVSFDISFIDPETQEELQPANNKTVEVTFNYEENPKLKTADIINEMTLKVYHLEDKDNKGNDLEELEVKEVKDVEMADGELVVSAESFSTYTVVLGEENPELDATIIGDDSARNSFKYRTITISDGTTSYTLMDRNLGARVAWDPSTYSLSTDNTSNYDTENDYYGYYYQWGNNWGFSSKTTVGQAGPVTVNSDKMPSNFSGSTWINTNSWDNGSSSNNYNYDLWGNVTNTDQARQGPCPSGWHVPSSTEWSNIRSAWCLSKGYSSTCTNGQVFAEALLLPAAGFRFFSDLSFYGRGSYGLGSYGTYWSSTPYDADYAFGLYFNSSAIGPQDSNLRSHGRPVRCLQNSPTRTVTFTAAGDTFKSVDVKRGSTVSQPTTSPTITNGTFSGWYLSGAENPFDFTTAITEDIELFAKWKCNDGYKLSYKQDSCVNDKTIEIVDGETDEVIQSFVQEYNDLELYFLSTNDAVSHYTLMDRNLGASTGYNQNWSSPNSDSYGYVYQWGNNYGFTSTATSTLAESTTSTIAKTIWEKYIPSQYGRNTWSTSSNWMASSSTTDGIWGGTGDTTSSDGADTTKEGRQGPCPEGYYIPSTYDWLTMKNDWYNSKASTSNIGMQLASDWLMPSAGSRNYNRAVCNEGSYGYYWSSSPNQGYSDYARYLYFDSSNIYPQDTYNRSNGFSVRCVKNSPNSQTLTLHANGGSKAVIGVLSGDGKLTISTLGSPTSTTADFAAWYTTSNFQEGTEVSTGDDITSVTDLYAKWGCKTGYSKNAQGECVQAYTVTYDATTNGGSVSTTSEGVEKGSTLTLGSSYNTATKEGWTFVGWNTDPTAQVGLESITVNENTTLYAIFSKTVTITFDANGSAGSNQPLSCTMYNTATTCSITSPSISASAGWTVVGYDDEQNGHTNEWSVGVARNVSENATYYAQTKKTAINYSVSFDTNGATSLSSNNESCTLPEVWNGSSRSETCNITAPTITREGWTKIGFNTSASATASQLDQGDDLVLSSTNSGTTYYAITKKEAINLTANVDGNTSTLSSNAQLQCTLDEVYNTDTQATYCDVDMPTVTNTKTPELIGWNIVANTDVNNSAYTSSTNKLRLTSDNTNNTWYAITTAPEKTLNITYGIGVGVSSIGSGSDSCTIAATYNGTQQSTSCTVIAPSITVANGYSEENKKWTDQSETTTQVVPGATITLTSDKHLSASAEYEAGTTPISYSITYHIDDGAQEGRKDNYTVEDDTFTLVNPIKEYYTFAGWTGTDLTQATQTVTIEKGTKYKNLEYYATWNADTDTNNNGIADEEETKYSVIYTDGVESEIVFANQVTSNLLSGTATPSFTGNTTRINYIFSGWTPSIADNVTANATYTAQWKEDMNNNGIDDTTEEKHIIVIKDGDTILSEQELIPGIAIVLPTAPTKAGYTFDGRDGLPTDGKSIDENLTITAKWKKNETTPTDTTPRAGGGSGGGRSITTNTSNTNEHSSAELTGSAEQKSSEDTNKENNSTTEKEATAIDSSFESEEVTDAYKWAYANDITTLLPIESNPDGKLLRGHLAKMLVNYSVNVLGKEVPTISEECKNWNDDASEWESEEIKSYAEQACALGLMGVDTYQHKFRPNQEVSRAQFGTTLSRLLYGEKYDGGFPYYEKHLKALNANNIMKNTDNPQQRIELRKWVWVMLQRIQEEKK